MALAIAGIGAAGAAFTVLADLGEFTLSAAVTATIAGLTYFMAHQSRPKA